MFGVLGIPQAAKVVIYIYIVRIICYYDAYPLGIDIVES